MPTSACSPPAATTAARRVWDLSAGCTAASELSRLLHRDPVTAVAFSSDSQYLVTASANIVRVHSWRADDLQRDACGRLRRNLTPEEWVQYLPGQTQGETCKGLPTGDDDAPLSDRALKSLIAGRPLEGWRCCKRRSRPARP